MFQDSFEDADYYAKEARTASEMESFDNDDPADESLHEEKRNIRRGGKSKAKQRIYEECDSNDSECKCIVFVHYKIIIVR